MQKINLKKELKKYYTQHKNKISIIRVPEFRYLRIDGKDKAYESEEFMDSLDIIYWVANSLKFMVKNGELQIDYNVMPLECVWWVDNTKKFTVDEKNDHDWSLMILQPDLITPEMLQQSIDEVRLKKDPERLDKIQFTTMADSYSAQILHVGPYEDADETIARMHDHIDNEGYKLSGKHREIYINDFRKVPSENLKMIIRQPVKKA